MSKGLKPFLTVRQNKPKRSVFDLSYNKLMTGDMGNLYPIMCDEVVPGDTFRVGNEIVIRFQPLVAPILHEINVYVHYFFVPYRILWDSWEDFITGGEDGEDETSLPFWSTSADTVEGSLWDYLGFPMVDMPSGSRPLIFPCYAYNQIYNDYYRDENLISPYALGTTTIRKRSWKKDYFTSALPWQQRGTAPALPISGTTSADFADAVSGTATLTTSEHIGVNSATSTLQSQLGTYNTELLAALNKNEVDLSVASTFDISDLRLAFQIQRWMEKNARGGARYTEFLKNHFGVAPRDERLQRPEYIGGTKSPVIVSEVLQTSQTDTTAQGTLAGHGITADRGYAGEYTASEFGLIMGIMSVMPQAVYQQGFDRQWLRRDRYDFFNPAFVNLSEQAIEMNEIYSRTVDSENHEVFGYQGMYDEMRIKRSVTCSGMRSSAATSFDYWHLARDFDTAPSLNQSFIECDPDKRVFAAPSEDGLIINVRNRIQAIRPLPVIAEPGLIDH